MHSKIAKWYMILPAAISFLACSASQAEERMPEPPEIEVDAGVNTVSARPMTVDEFFNNSNKENMAEMVEAFYAEDMLFVDPLGKIEGREKMLSYYQHLYDNIIEISFKIHSQIDRGDETVAVWTMQSRHESINDGELTVVDGVSHIHFKNGKAVYHRDYFDLGTMVYEHIPVLGYFVRLIKEKAGDHGDED